jgi:hypothetical protein
MPSGRLAAVDIMHVLSMELCTALGQMLAARWHGPMITMPVIVIMIYVAVKVFRPVKPWSRADKKAARKPLGSIVAVRRAVIGRDLIIAIRAYRRHSDTDCNLCIRLSCRREQKTRSHRDESNSS